MAQTESVYFLDGPCDGQTKQVPVSVVRTGSITCGGQTYLVDISLATPDHPLVAALKGGPHEVVVTRRPLHVSQAWSRWMHALAHNGPRSHREIMKAAARARRIARH